VASLIEDVQLLQHPRSPKRRSAAKRLRKLRDPSAGPALLEALKREVTDPRTWETQYQMIMALGECKYLPALSYLKELADRSFEATMVYVALGDALVRLQFTPEQEAVAVTEVMDTGNEMLIDGAFRAMAMLRMVPRTKEIREILSFASALPPDSGLRFWPLVATAGWKGDTVEAFIDGCAKSNRVDLREAAEQARTGKYGNWRPL
jgi:hypothetical protein